MAAPIRVDFFFGEIPRNGLSIDCFKNRLPSILGRFNDSNGCWENLWKSCL